jgi:NADH-quinone oxidoreductase subunit J
MIEQAFFAVLAAVTLGAAIAVVTARSVFVSALWLVLSFLGVAGLYVLLDAGFLAVIQVLLYVGAISVLILFAVMLTRNMMTEQRAVNAQWAVAVVLGLLLFGALAATAYRGHWQLNQAAVVPPGGGVVVSADGIDDPALVPGVVAAPTPRAPETPQAPAAVLATGTTAALGRSFVTDYLLAFEVAGAIVLVAMIGAIVIARE